MKVRVLDLGVLKVNASSISLAGELIERRAESSTRVLIHRINCPSPPC